MSVFRPQNRRQHRPRRPIAGAPALVVSLAFLLGASDAFAIGTPPVELDWSAPDGCPSAEDVLREISRTLAPAARPVRVRAVVRADAGDAWFVALEVESDGTHSERRFAGRSCAAVARAVAVIAAFSADPSRSASAPDLAAAASDPPGPLLGPPPRPSEPPRAPETSAISERPGASVSAHPRAAADRAPATEAKPGSTSRAALALSVVSDSGTLPSFAVGGEIALAWRIAPLRIEAYAADWLGQRATVGDAGTQGGVFQLLSAGLRSCYVVVPKLVRRLELGPCLGIEGDWMRAGSFGTMTSSAGDALWAELSAGGGGSFELTHAVALRASLAAHVPFDRPDFFIRRAQDVSVHTVAGIAARGQLGVEARFF